MRTLTVIRAIALAVMLALPSFAQNIGTTAVTGTVTGSGNFTVVQATASNLNATVVGTGTFAVQVDGSALTALQLIDNPVQVLGTDTYTEATSSGSTIGCVRRDADTTLVNTTNEFAPCQLDANGRIKVEAFSGETLPVSLTSTTITGQVTVGDGTDAVDVEAAGADNLSNTNNQLITGAHLYGYDGSTWDRITNGNGTAATALRVSLASDSTGQVAVASFPDNEPFNMAQLGGTAVVADRCQREQNLYIAINQTANTQLVTGTASERIYICSFNVVTATAQNVALVSGTGSTCATSTSGLEGFGGATAATGWNFAANGGIAYGTGGNALGRTDTDGDNVCLFQSGAGQLSGGFSYVSN